MKIALPYPASRFSSYYEEIVYPDLLLKLPIQNIHELPKLNKLVLHSSSSDIVQDKKRILPILTAFEYLTGQKAITTWSKKSVAAFRLRKNMLLGCRVTLRKNVLFRFFEKYTVCYLPRLYDWQILSGKHKRRVVEPNRGHRDAFLFFELEPFVDLFQGFRGFQLNWHTMPSKSSKVSQKQVRHLIFSAFQGI
ncbi:MAG: 50S ribosomal protein L5 [Candidatus Staskawiczbacteria bacterium]|nr:50S ribosomal protein L5 [Candidatus Staskawiczbacteria bacterium]